MSASPELLRVLARVRDGLVSGEYNFKRPIDIADIVRSLIESAGPIPNIYFSGKYETSSIPYATLCFMLDAHPERWEEDCRTEYVIAAIDQFIATNGEKSWYGIC